MGLPRGQRHISETRSIRDTDRDWSCYLPICVRIQKLMLLSPAFMSAKANKPMAPSHVHSRHWAVADDRHLEYIGER